MFREISINWYYIAGLVQERRNSSALAMDLRLFCTNLSIYFMCTAGTAKCYPGMCDHGETFWLVSENDETQLIIKDFFYLLD